MIQDIYQLAADPDVKAAIQKQIAKNGVCRPNAAYYYSARSGERARCRYLRKCAARIASRRAAL